MLHAESLPKLDDVPRRVTDFRGLTQPGRLRLLREIQRQPGRRASEIAANIEMPLNTARDHLWVLEDEGLIRGERVSTGTRGRPPIVYHPVREPGSNPAAEDRTAEALKRGALLRATTAAPAAHDRAAQAQIDVLYEHFDDAGLQPHVDDEALSFELAPCNYHDAIETDQSLVCSVHARLVGDVLRQVAGPLALKRLEPFVTPHRCRLQLTRRRNAAAPTPEA